MNPEMITDRTTPQEDPTTPGKRTQMSHKGLMIPETTPMRMDTTVEKEEIVHIDLMTLEEAIKSHITETMTLEVSLTSIMNKTDTTLATDQEIVTEDMMTRVIIETQDMEEEKVREKEKELETQVMVTETIIEKHLEIIRNKETGVIEDKTEAQVETE